MALSIVGRAFLGLLLLGWVASSAHAQVEMLRKTTPEQRAAAQTQFIEAKLALDAKTTASVAALNLETAQKAQSVIQNASSRFSLGKGLRKLNAERDEKLKKLISPKQWKIFENSQDEMKKAVMADLEKAVRAAP